MLEIPWTGARGSGLIYVNLKANPEKIKDLSECRAYPALADLLRRVNRPETQLYSAKCDVWETSELAEDERADFNLPYKVASYLDLVVESRHSRADRERYLRLAATIGQKVRRLRVRAQMEIAVRRCLFHPEEEWGYYLTVYLHAYGSTSSEAREEWQRVLRALGKNLAEVGVELQGTLRNRAEKKSCGLS
jgi:hypothetical protein